MMSFNALSLILKHPHHPSYKKQKYPCQHDLAYPSVELMAYYPSFGNTSTEVCTMLLGLVLKLRQFGEEQENSCLAKEVVLRDF